MNDKLNYRHVHVRIDLPLWRQLRARFPEYGDIRRVINLALGQFLERWDRDLEEERQNKWRLIQLGKFDYITGEEKK